MSVSFYSFFNMEGYKEDYKPFKSTGKLTFALLSWADM